MCKSFPRPIWPQIIIGDPTVGSESDLRFQFFASLLQLFITFSHFLHREVLIPRLPSFLFGSDIQYSRLCNLLSRCLITGG